VSSELALEVQETSLGAKAIPGDFDHFGNLIQRRPEIISLFVGQRTNPQPRG